MVLYIAPRPSPQLQLLVSSSSLASPHSTAGALHRLTLTLTLPSPYHFDFLSFSPLSFLYPLPQPHRPQRQSPTTAAGSHSFIPSIRSSFFYRLDLIVCLFTLHSLAHPRSLPPYHTINSLSNFKQPFRCSARTIILPIDNTITTIPIPRR
ncbi:hypothetical protein VTL71DRAFT_7352 [Oculimacula yallundae]|uniref:Uncharacterized protein n=1 Tax=Oculimacula yallundae TaxID=86028 RepID=A0ABR4BWF4_9HELO